MRIKISVIEGFISKEIADFGPEDFGNDPRPWNEFAGSWIRKKYPDGIETEISVIVEGEVILSRRYNFRPHRAEELGRYMV